MAMAYITLIQPGDAEAGEWYQRYQQYRKLSGSAARWYAWRYESDVWLFAILTPLLVCGLGQWWIDVLVGCALGMYWAWAFERKRRVQRQYERLLRKRRILRAPSFIVAALDKEAERLGMLDWDEYPARRFDILSGTLLEAGPWLGELGNDCGCRHVCGHTNRLTGRVRDSLRRRVRILVRRKAEQASQDHQAAIEMNKLRHRHIRGALKATPEEDDW